ncbi:rhomboid family intramembrane serine protease [Planctomyces sp. SH-PL62]|uniref:rhomboid family intramembrane serine protease n=1 Tax=Planctomyces sp. SH-PL62 TaxID=1636152 RepID=UPI00078BF9D8|nr:rhomboid family intramembrane serine protease [Planctomyces sp. SH-PL62]AMV39647.1 Rhomboid protease GluP [Planctomyces sp. SH-PL62]
MTPRLLLRELRDYPATVLFCASWLVVFVAMVALQVQGDAGLTSWRVLLTGIGDGRRFGDLTLQDLANGEYWRLITCNFVHYSVIHIGLNLFAFYLLGSLLESWYGPWTLIAIYGTTGVGGNLFSALARRAIGANPLIHSGGGSVVIMGLIGLCATAGWASRSTRDRELTWQMLKALAITGALGLAFPRYIDNWGHAGGAIAGLPIGLAHSRLLAGRGRPRTWGVGMAWGLVLLAGGVAQAFSDRTERDARAVVAARRDLDAHLTTSRVVLAARQWAYRGGDSRGLEALLRSQAAILDREPTRAAYRRLLPLAAEFSRRKPTEPELLAFRRELEAVRDPVRATTQARLETYWERRRRGGRPASAPARVPVARASTSSITRAPR